MAAQYRAVAPANWLKALLWQAARRMRGVAQENDGLRALNGAHEYTLEYYRAEVRRLRARRKSVAGALYQGFALGLGIGLTLCVLATLILMSGLVDGQLWLGYALGFASCVGMGFVSQALLRAEAVRAQRKATREAATSTDGKPN